MYTTRINMCLVISRSNIFRKSFKSYSSGQSGKELKKFYKNVTISQGNGGFEVNLDQKKLKTPMGALFQVPTEPLALAAAAEWHAQDQVIKRHSMHMNLLCNSAIDNPSGRQKDTVVAGILEYLQTDTICYRLEDPEDLVQFQVKHWDPLINWLKDRYNVVVEPTTGLGVPHIPEDTQKLFKQHLESYNEWALVGYQQTVEHLKSMILAFALIDRQITVEEAVFLSRLEMEFQIAKWGNVEWHHDVEQLDLRARIAAATLFVHFNSEESKITFRKGASRDPV